MNIGVDARPLVSKKAGIGYYLNDVLLSILKYDTENNYYLFSDRKIDFPHENFKNVFLIGELHGFFLKKTLWYVFKLSSILKTYKIDLFWGTQHVLPYFTSDIKTVLTIHDLVAFRYPETMKFYNKCINKAFIPSSIRRANSLIAVSNSTKNDIIKYFNINTNKIKVIYEDIILEDYNHNIKIDIDKFGLKDKGYILFIGTIEPRKNLKLLLESFEKIKDKTNLDLIICGKIGWGSDDIIRKIKNHKYKENIHYLNYVSQQEKIFLLRNCFAFIFPSIYEGFGLPAIEAIKSDRIAIVSDVSSLKEIIEIDELKFKSNDSNDLTNKIVELYFDKNKYNKCLKYCKERAKDFDWNKFSKEYINEFYKLLNQQQ
jgi:glycosyltransferase involved in cell wall biosynthesis